MQIKRMALIVACLLMAIASRMPATAQRAIELNANPRNSQVPSRVLESVDDTRLVTLTGNTHFLARAQFDQGLADPQLRLERMVLLLKRSPQQEAELEQLMAEQYDSKSSNFHHWLQPEEFGKLYGPSDADIAAVTNWLQNHGFQIYIVNKGRVTIEFSGTAEQVQNTFHVEMHHYLVEGQLHLANDRDPSIPEALAPVVQGIASLHDFFPVHQSVLGKHVRRDKKTGKITPLEPEFSGAKPEYGFTNEEGDPQEDITPYDFATIYNLLPLWNAGITGKGQTIAISAVTDIVASDVSFFRSTFGLGGFTGTINQIHNGSDPGVLSGAQVENTLDTEWSGATAPDATVDVVISASTATTFGGQLSDSYIVEHPSMFTIMSASYGGCEIGLGTAGNSALNSIYQQGSAEGISMFESAGDQGSAGCDNSDATTFPNPAQYGLNVNGDASSPYITAVGGTEFTWQNFRTTYWSATNSTTNLSNALGYIPESPWDGTCTSQVLLDRLWQPFYGYTTLEEVCNNVVGQGVPAFVSVVGGSGGVSSCITSTGGEFSTCGGGYAQPSWQKGVTGMPGTQYRYLPDVSLFASSGFQYGINGSAYLICVASNSPTKTCNYSNVDYIVAQEVGGTSVSSPALAGIMALVQQKQGAAQGLANPVFYALAAKDNLTNCNSSTVANGNACNFYDVTYGNNSEPCTTGARDCVTNTSGDTYGIVSGYTTTTGYDEATGLGSVNAANLVNNWASTAGSPTITLSPTSVTFPSTTVGTTSTTVETVTIQNTGTAAASISTIEVTGADATSYTIASTGTTACSGTLAAAASCAVEISFTPVAAGTLTATFEVLDNAGTGTQSIPITGTGASTATETITLSPTSLTFSSTVEGSSSAAQTITVKNTGTGTVTLNSETLTGTNANSYLISANTCTSSLTSGASCSVSIELKPVATGTLTASLSVADNATGSPQTVSLTGTGASSTNSSGLQFVPAIPCRIADTRNATGPFGGPELAAGSIRTFNIPQSACGIPSTAVAYSLNVTVIPNASLSYLTLWPAGQAQPNVSTLNSDGRIKANASIMPAGTNGGVSIFVTNATQVILDIDGYFVPAGTASALAFYPLTPCRVADTRQSAGPLGGPSLPAGGSRAFPVSSSACNIPSTAKAYSLNVTAIPHKTLNYLTTWPSGESQPNVSTLNSSTGAVAANAAIVPAGIGGDISIFVSDAADVILDVNGYFAAPATGGLSLYGLTPCRVIDTRSAVGTFDGVLPIPVESSACATPSAAQAYVFNATVVPAGALNYLTLWPNGQTQPNVSTLNADDGAITSNMAIVPTANGSVNAFSSDPTNLILDISGYFAP